MGEKKMKKFIKGWCRYNIPDANVFAENGNLYITKGVSDTYPCVVAHLDQVQDKHSKDFRCYMSDGKVYGFSVEEMRMEGLGADDKNGIWVALKCLLKYDVLKVAFFCGEEIGCVGSEKANMQFFSDCRWVVQCDRKGGKDLITNASYVELCSEEFINAIHMEAFGYEEEHGLMTDVMTLKEKGLAVSCVNMSCGYYRPHTDGEYTVVDELTNCLHFVQWMIENVTDVYPHEYLGYAYPKYDDDYWRGYYGYGYDGYGYSKEQYNADDDELANTIASLLWEWPDATAEDIYEEVKYWTSKSKTSVMKIIKETMGQYAQYKNAS